jgi:hypothetical protein
MMNLTDPFSAWIPTSLHIPPSRKLILFDPAGQQMVGQNSLQMAHVWLVFFQESRME